MFPWQPKVVGLWLLKEERKIVTVRNRLARKDQPLSAKVWDFVIAMATISFSKIKQSTHIGKRQSMLTNGYFG